MERVYTRKEPELTNYLLSPEHLEIENYIKELETSIKYIKEKKDLFVVLVLGLGILIAPLIYYLMCYLICINESVY